MALHPLPSIPTAPYTLPAPIPRGVADYFWQQAHIRRFLMTDLIDLFRSWGYLEVMPPAFEYAETLDLRASPALRGELYRFVDRDGSTLALRADMTIPVARLVGTRLHDMPMPQRFSYAGSVFRYGETQAGMQREFRQAGIELIGAGEPAADAEVLALTVRGLEQAGLTDVRLAVGHLGYFDALVGELALPEDAQLALLEAIDRNSDAALAGFLQQTALDGAQRSVVARLPHLSGEATEEILTLAAALCLNDAMRDALANLRAVLDALALHALDRPLYLDFTEIHNLGYYTGLTFEALTPGLGFPVASGGRYDNLVGSFGPPQPAVGSALLIDRILLALRQNDPEPGTDEPNAAVVVVGGLPGAQPLQTVDLLRRLGVTVVLEHRPHANVGALWAQARPIAPLAVLYWDGKSFRLQADAARSRRMSTQAVIDWGRALTGAKLPVFAGFPGAFDDSLPGGQGSEPPSTFDAKPVRGKRSP